MIDAIYASKLYRASKRKPAIVAAANNPINTELVTQLADALSPVYKKEEYLVDKESEKAKAETRKARETKESKVDAPEGTEDESSRHTKPAGGGGKPSSSLVDSFRKAKKHEEEDSGESSKPEEPKSDDSGSVENATFVSGKPVTAARMLVTDMKQVVDEIKGLLNLQDTTAGVNRILVKEESEFWIYYNDSINLNNVMASVIEALNAAGYTYLEFNRLARSDNAMVFQILFKDTAAETKPVESEEKDEKDD